MLCLSLSVVTFHVIPHSVLFL